MAATHGLDELDVQCFRFACGLEVTVHGLDISSSGDLAHAAFHLGLDPAVFAPGAPMRYRVLRQDDHGGRFEMRQFTSRCEADAFVADYTQRLHHQIYWCEELT